MLTLDLSCKCFFRCDPLSVKAGGFAKPGNGNGGLEYLVSAMRGRGVTSVAGHFVRTSRGRCGSKGDVVRNDNRVGDTRVGIEAGVCVTTLPALPQHQGTSGSGRVVAGPAGMASSD